MNEALLPQPNWKEYTSSCPIDLVNSEVREIAAEVLAEAQAAQREDNKLTLFHVSGPALVAIRFSLPCLFGFVLLFPLVAWATSQCPAQDELYADCPWILWILFLPLFGSITWWEWKAFRIMVVPYAQWLAPFKILGKGVSLSLWFAFMFMMSSAAKLDIATISLFAAKIFATVTCHTSLWPAAQAAWEEAIKKSSMCWMPLANQLIFVCALGWFVIIMQCVIAFMMSHPKEGVGQTNYNWRGEPAGYSTLWTTLFDVFHGSINKTHHADAVRTVGAAIRNLTLVDQSCNWQMERTRQHLELRGEDLVQQQRCFDMLYRETQRAAFWLWGVTICEKAVVMESQTSMYAMLRALDQGSDRQIQFTLFISFIGLVKALFDAHCQVARLKRTHKEVMVQMKELMLKSQEDEGAAEAAGFTTPLERIKACLFGLPRPGELPIEKDILREARRAKLIIVFGMRFGTIFLALILVHTFIKLVAAPRCKYGFWNFPLDWPSLEQYGCVDLSGIKLVEEARRGR